MPNSKNAAIVAKISTQDLEKIKRAAEQLGVSIAGFVRLSVFQRIKYLELQSAPGGAT